jgi:hypothetical protein
MIKKREGKVSGKIKRESERKRKRREREKS